MMQYVLTNGTKYVEGYAPQRIGSDGELVHNGNVLFCEHLDYAKLFKSYRGAKNALTSVPTFNLKIAVVEVSRQIIDFS